MHDLGSARMMVLSPYQPNPHSLCCTMHKRQTCVASWPLRRPCYVVSVCLTPPGGTLPLSLYLVVECFAGRGQRCLWVSLQVIERANDTEYGLAAGVFSKNIDWINSISRSESSLNCQYCCH